MPDDINVHCLAGLIKAWFRELPAGVLDGLSPEQVLRCNMEEEFIELVEQLKPTETALLNWAIELMADVVEQEESNKMNARNIAMVFAPNMTQVIGIYFCQGIQNLKFPNWLKHFVLLVLVSDV